MSSARPAIAPLTPDNIHFDGKPLQSARFIANLWAFIETVEHPGFSDLDWPTAQNLLTETSLTKYADYNFFNLIHEPPGKVTFEVRVLPVLLEAIEIIAMANLFETIIKAACEGNHLPTEVKKLLNSDHCRAA